MLLVDSILDIFFGYTFRHGWRSERDLAQKSFEHSAQIATIVGRGSYSLSGQRALHNFLLWHDEYVHPNYVLEHDNVTLYGYSKTHAYFCISSPEVSVTNIKVRK